MILYFLCFTLPSYIRTIIISYADKMRLHMMTHAGGRTRRGRGRGRSSSTARTDRQIKTEANTPEHVKCSMCQMVMVHCFCNVSC